MNYLRPLLILAGVMLLLAVPPIWPYGYYQVLRIVVCIAAAYGAYTAFTTERAAWVWVLGAVAVLFNPIAPVYLDKETWVIPDIIAGILLLVASAKLEPNAPKH